MSALASWLTSLPEMWKAITALGAVAGLASTCTVATMRFTGVPELVQAHESAIEQNSVTIADHVELPYHEGVLEVIRQGDAAIIGRLDRLICLQTLPENTPPLEANRECP
jgi:hypothetical protein